MGLASGLGVGTNKQRTLPLRQKRSLVTKVLLSRESYKLTRILRQCELPLSMATRKPYSTVSLIMVPGPTPASQVYP
jgi:hypothetical protein